MLSTSLVLQICFMTMSAKIAVKFLHQTSLLKFAYKLYSSVLVLCCLTCCRPLEEELHGRCPQAAEMGLCCQPQISQPSCLAPILTWSPSNPNSLEYVFFFGPKWLFSQVSTVHGPPIHLNATICSSL